MDVDVNFVAVLFAFAPRWGGLGVAVGGGRFGDDGDFRGGGGGGFLLIRVSPELLPAHGGVYDVEQAFSGARGVDEFIARREGLSDAFQSDVDGDLPRVVERELAVRLYAALELLDPVEVATQAVEGGVDGLLGVLEVVTGEIVLGVPSLAGGRGGKENLSEAGVEVARGGAEGAGERAAHHRETRLALEGLTLLFLPGLREDALAARDNLIHGEKHEETGEAARDGGRRLVLELQDQLLLKALESGGRLAFPVTLGIVVRPRELQTEARRLGRGGTLPQTHLLEETPRARPRARPSVTRSANRHAEHVIAVLTWPLEDSGNPERGFFSSESPVRKPTPRSAKTILLM